MLKQLFYSKSVAPELLESALHTETTFYISFSKDLRKAQREVITESPFIACKRTESLLPSFK